MTTEAKIPFGKAKGQTVSQCPLPDLEWAINAIARKVDENPEGEYSDRNRVWLRAARAAFERRKAGPGAPAPAAAPSTALTKAAPTGVSLDQVAHEPAAITARLVEFASSYHLVSAATHVDALPEGFGVTLSIVSVSPDATKSGPGEVYDVGGGKVGLSGTKLLEIGSAAGVDWNPRESGRLDNGSHPHYCHYRAVGTVRNLDGSERTIMGEVEIDAREGSPQVDEIRQKAAGRENGDGGARQLLELRKFLLRHAETKAKCRAIASLGVKRSYHPAELAKPFAVARLMFTGRTNDPELRREFARMTAQAALGARAALYGSGPALPSRPAPASVPSTVQPAAPAPLPAYVGHEPPAVGAVEPDEPWEGEEIEPSAEEPQTSAPPPLNGQ